jgi:hypothetical protein
MSLVHAAVAFLIGSLAVARATRLVTSDAYPPAKALRVWWANKTEVHGGWRDGWAPLLTCPFCFAPYAAAADLAWALWSHAPALPHLPAAGGWWWVVNVWAAGSYLASMIVVRDEPPEE